MGLDGGYASSKRLDNSPPASVHGGVAGLHLAYWLNETWALAAHGSFDGHQRYEIGVLGEIPGGQAGETSVGYVNGPRVRRSYLLAAAVSVLYGIDVLRLFPYIGLGAVVARAEQTIDGLRWVGLEAGVRFIAGVKYEVLDVLEVGAVLHSDTILYTTSDFYNRLAILARFTYVFDLGGRDDEKNEK